MMKMTAKIFGIGVVLLVFSAMTADSFAHGGGTNAVKCHRDRKANECHCHAEIGNPPQKANLAYCNADKVREFKSRKRSEADYAARFCASRGGLIEARLANGTRVDCLTVGHAIEADFAPKWREAVEQARGYANETGATPSVLLIMIAPDDEAHLLSLCQAAVESSPPIVVFATGEAAAPAGQINCAEFLNG